jgi:hypothetical protein
MRARSILWLSMAAVTVLLTPVQGSAQDGAKADVAVSYTALYDSSIGDAGYGSWSPFGWLVGFGGHLNDTISIVGEFGGSYKSISESGVDVTLNIYNYMGGVRFRGRGNPKAIPFGQVLIGGAHVGVGADAAGYNVGVSTNGFSLQPGGGVDVFFAKNAGVRIQGDYRVIWAEGDNSSEFRIAAGVVFTFGGK